MFGLWTLQIVVFLYSRREDIWLVALEWMTKVATSFFSRHDKVVSLTDPSPQRVYTYIGFRAVT